MTAPTLDFQGTMISPDGDDLEHDSFRVQLLDLARVFPVGSRVQHACGRGGYVTLDQPVHVPGYFLKRQTAVCLAGPDGDMPMVFVSWDNEYEFVWRVWAPFHLLRPSAAPVINRPGNMSRIGGRR